MLKAQVVPILMVLAASLLGAAGQYLIRLATQRQPGGGLTVLVSPAGLAGVACYLAVLVLFTGAFRAGGTVTVVYPVYALTFVWAAVLGRLVYEQPIRPLHMAGMVLLVVGIVCMSTQHQPLGPEVRTSASVTSEGLGERARSAHVRACTTVEAAPQIQPTTTLDVSTTVRRVEHRAQPPGPEAIASSWEVI